MIFSLVQKHEKYEIVATTTIDSSTNHVGKKREGIKGRSTWRLHKNNNFLRVNNIILPDY